MARSALRGSLALPLLAALAVGGCAQGAGRASAAGTPRRSAATPAPSATPAPPADRLTVGLARLDRMLAGWDQAQGAGQTATADVLAQHLRQEVDGAYPDVRAAFDGVAGQEGRYLATMALGFASAPDATRLLVERLADRDPRLVANALLALRLRRDPATPLVPVARHLGSGDEAVRRYAPLTLAHVLDARRRAGVAPDAEFEAQALPVLAAQARDREPVVRLHAARGLAELSVPGAGPALLELLKDRHAVVRLAAARGLARRGERQGMLEVLRLLNEAPSEDRPAVVEALAVYAEKLSGAPLPAGERQRLGSNAMGWMRWYADWDRDHPVQAPAPEAAAPSAPRG